MSILNEHIQTIREQAAEIVILRSRIAQLENPVGTYKYEEMVQINDPRYRGIGVFIREQPRRIGVRLEHGQIRWFDFHTVTPVPYTFGVEGE